ncbi:MAG TPA: hypothetical protein PLR39_12095 [Treponemataceae bacterium]|nr:hypothetical protein [Treponemataceae bacterium]
MDKRPNNQKQKWHNNSKRNDRSTDQSGPQQTKKKFNPIPNKKQEQIQHIELETFICPRCSQPITDLPSALADRTSGEPVHFDCVLQFLQNAEELKQNEKITYIGQGRFAVTYFENPHDLRKFNIVRIIDWEERDKVYEWRDTISGLFSQVK